MKKFNARSIFFVLLIATSFFSYVYINSVSIGGDVSENTEEVQAEPKEDEAQEILLPDVRLLKKMVETGKRFLPAS